MYSLKAEWKQSHFFDALHPVLNVFEGLLVCDVVHQDDALAQSKDRDKERGLEESVKATERAQRGSDVSLIIQSARSAGILCSPWLLCSRLS